MVVRMTISMAMLGSGGEHHQILIGDPAHQGHQRGARIEEDGALFLQKGQSLLADDGLGLYVGDLAPAVKVLCLGGRGGAVDVGAAADADQESLLLQRSQVAAQSHQGHIGILLGQILNAGALVFGNISLDLASSFVFHDCCTPASGETAAAPDLADILSIPTDARSDKTRETGQNVHLLFYSIDVILSRKKGKKPFDCSPI